MLIFGEQESARAVGVGDGVGLRAVFVRGIGGDGEADAQQQSGYDRSQRAQALAVLHTGLYFLRCLIYALRLRRARTISATRASATIISAGSDASEAPVLGETSSGSTAGAGVGTGVTTGDSS